MRGDPRGGFLFRYAAISAIAAVFVVVVRGCRAIITTAGGGGGFALSLPRGAGSSLSAFGELGELDFDSRPGTKYEKC